MYQLATILAPHLILRLSFHLVATTALISWSSGYAILKYYETRHVSGIQCRKPISSTGAVLLFLVTGMSASQDLLNCHFTGKDHGG